MGLALGTAVLLVVLLAALSLFVATRPATFKVERSALISAPPENVFPLINDFHQWDRWSPYEKRDPNMKRTFGGAASGEGAVYSWDGNNQIGAGRMTLLESRAGELVKIRLEFFRPFRATNQALFTLTPAENGTRVSWSMEGKNTLPGKLMSLLINMDRMVGRDFEQGLATLDATAQAEAARLSRV